VLWAKGGWLDDFSGVKSVNELRNLFEERNPDAKKVRYRTTWANSGRS
jgi:hypothetical protein